MLKFSDFWSDITGTHRNALSQHEFSRNDKLGIRWSGGSSYFSTMDADIACNQLGLQYHPEYEMHEQPYLTDKLTESLINLLLMETTYDYLT